MWYKENVLAAANDPTISEGAKRYLDEALVALNFAYQESKIPVKENTPDSLMIADTEDELLQQQYFELLANFDFIESFTVFEFKVFQNVIAAAFKQNEARGRPRKDLDKVQRTQDDFSTLKDCFKGLRKNLLTHQMEYLRRNPDSNEMEWYQLQGNDLDQISTNLALDFGIHIPLIRARSSLIAVAERNPYRPTSAMVDLARAKYPSMTLEEAKDFLSTLGTELLGVIPEEPDINGRSLRDEAMYRWFCGTVRVARQPGNTLQWLPILIGKQGCGKSQFCRFLIPDNFQDTLCGEITTPLDTLKKEPYRLHTAFLHELAEIDDKMRKESDSSPLKNLVTAKNDDCRFPYDRLPVKLKRQFVIIGTTNRDTLFVDPTGNRRYLPIKIPDNFLIPWQELGESLNWKIWAAADIIVESLTDSPEWLVGFTMEELQIIDDYQQGFAQEDPWEAPIKTFVASHSIFKPDELLQYLEIPRSQQGPKDNKRIDDIIKRVYNGKVYKDRRRIDGIRATWYFRNLPDEETESTNESVPLSQFASDLLKVDF
jgi:predicted P-loop ATPase